jgi:hypothetical protein
VSQRLGGFAIGPVAEPDRNVEAAAPFGNRTSLGIIRDLESVQQATHVSPMAGALPGRLCRLLDLEADACPPLRVDDRRLADDVSAGPEICGHGHVVHLDQCVPGVEDDGPNPGTLCHGRLSRSYYSVPSIGYTRRMKE